MFTSNNKSKMSALMGLLLLAGAASAETAPKRKISQSAPSTMSIAAPMSSTNDFNFSFNMETKLYPAQRNGDQKDASTSSIAWTPEGVFKFATRHKVIVTILDIEQNLASEKLTTSDSGAIEKSELNSFNMADTRFRYRYLMTSPKLKSHKAQFNFSYVAPTSEASQDKGLGGMLEARFDYLHNIKVDGVAITLFAMPYYKKYLLQNAKWEVKQKMNGTTPVVEGGQAVWEPSPGLTDFAMGSLLGINFDIGKFFMENTVDARIAFPAKYPDTDLNVQTGDVSTTALLESYLGYNFNDTFSGFLYYVNVNKFVDKIGYDFDISDASAATFGAGFRVNF